MTIRRKMMAAAVAGLLAGAAMTVPPAVHAGDKDAKVKCGGINSCKGKGSCASARNGCSGQNSCKGKGWVESTAKDCTSKGGKVVTEGGKDSGGKK